MNLTIIISINLIYSNIDDALQVLILIKSELDQKRIQWTLHLFNSPLENSSAKRARAAERCADPAILSTGRLDW